MKKMPATGFVTFFVTEHDAEIGQNISGKRDFIGLARETDSASKNHNFAPNLNVWRGLDCLLA